MYQLNLRLLVAPGYTHQRTYHEPIIPVESMRCSKLRPESEADYNGREGNQSPDSNVDPWPMVDV